MSRSPVLQFHSLIERGASLQERRLRLVAMSVVGVIVASFLTGPGAAQAASARATHAKAPRLRLGYPGLGSVDGTQSTRAGRAFLSRRYLVPDPAAYEAAKAAADARAAGSVPSVTPELRGRALLSAQGPDRNGATASRDRIDSRPGNAPISPMRPTVSAWEGVYDSTGTPSDSAGAIGPTRYVEMVNTKIGIYSRDHLLLASAGLDSLTGDPFLTDPQIIWDPTTSRFYFVMLNFDVAFTTASDGVDFEFGFSTTESPSTIADWCTYSVSAGYDDPTIGGALVLDQPHLGDSQNFVFWGGNAFDVGASTAPYVGSDVVWVSKPTAGISCPAGSAFTLGTQIDLRNADGSPTWTPVAVNQTDADASGWLVGSEFPDTGSADALTLLQVTDNGDGTANVQTTGAALPVPSFSTPANALQGGGIGAKLDTMDTRLTQAVSAINPSRSGLAIWTQHTVFGGAGAQVRWYEINPTGPSLFQSGTLSSSNLFVFNAAISPDRLLNGATAVFGDTMGIGFTTSSIYTDTTLWVASKTGNDGLSPWVMVKQSPGPNLDRSCSPCRWGDYMGATPDPAADPLGNHGVVWMTSMWNAKSRTLKDFDWRTTNWETEVVPNSSNCTMIGTSGADFITGSGGVDVLCGADGADILLGGNGNDNLLGGSGNDLLVPEGGNDVVDGGAGQDFVDYETTRARILVDLAARVAKGQGTDRLVGIEHAVGSAGSDRLFGSGAGNALYGLAGADALHGGAGRDYLNGGPGNDYLDGQRGSDRCATGGGTDTKVSCER